MAIEIERKFLVTGDGWKDGSDSLIYFQGYICSGTGNTVRIRIAGDHARLTIKGKHNNISRLEYEYPLPLEDAQAMLDQVCEPPVIHKRRYFHEYEGFTWEIDEFFGENEGLVLAEIELQSEEQEFPRPDWLGKEVSNDGRYYNASLRSYPYKQWQDNDK